MFCAWSQRRRAGWTADNFLKLECFQQPAYNRDSNFLHRLLFFFTFVYSYSPTPSLFFSLFLFSIYSMPHLSHGIQGTCEPYRIRLLKWVQSGEKNYNINMVDEIYPSNAKKKKLNFLQWNRIQQKKPDEIQQVEMKNWSECDKKTNGWRWTVN